MTFIEPTTFSNSCLKFFLLKIRKVVLKHNSTILPNDSQKPCKQASSLWGIEGETNHNSPHPPKRKFDHIHPTLWPISENFLMSAHVGAHKSVYLQKWPRWDRVTAGERTMLKNWQHEAIWGIILLALAQNSGLWVSSILKRGHFNFLIVRQEQIHMLESEYQNLYLCRLETSPFLLEVNSRLVQGNSM